MALGSQQYSLLERSYMALMKRLSDQIERARQVGDQDKVTDLIIQRMQVKQNYLRPTTPLVDG